MVREPPRCIFRPEISQIVTAIDRPIVAASQKIPELGTVPGFRSQESALARLLLESLVEIGKVNNGNL